MTFAVASETPPRCPGEPGPRELPARPVGPDIWAGSYLSERRVAGQVGPGPDRGGPSVQESGAEANLALRALNRSKAETDSRQNVSTGFMKSHPGGMGSWVSGFGVWKDLASLDEP